MPHIKSKYTQNDIKFIKDNYSTMSVKDIARNLSRSPKGVRSKIERMGLSLDKLTRNEPFLWTEEKDIYLRNNYKSMTDSEISNVLGTSQGIVIRRRKQLDLPKLTNDPFLSSGYYQRCVEGIRVWVHREQAELKIGRKLKKHEPVHHVDGNKLNNALENLYVCRDRKHHGDVHATLEEVAFSLCQLGIIKFDHEKGRYYHSLPTRTEG